MRKNSPRKWLHAILDLLPVLILPIFALAVRSDNNFQPIEVQAQQQDVVNFNQLYKGNGVTRQDGNTSLTQIEDSIIVNVVDGGQDVYFPFTNNVQFQPNHDYYLKSNSDSAKCLFYCYIDGTFTRLINDTLVSYNGNQTISFLFNTSADFVGTFEFKINIYDLTEMFKDSNTLTKNDFGTYFNNYYDYTTSKKQLVNLGTTTYNDTDVGSQMVYTLYNATDKYFNFNNVFNFGQIYDWFLLNIFNGNATLIFPVVWQIVLYEFIMDLVFLIYALFMFFIDFCTNLIDRFHVKCSGGK